MPTDINSIQAWCSVLTLITTLVGGFLVYQTFMLQAKAMADQNEILRIQQTDFRLKFFPKLIVNHATYIQGAEREDVISIEVTENAIKEIEMLYSGSDKIKFEPWFHEKELDVSVGFILKFSCKYLFSDHFESSIAGKPLIGYITFLFTDSYDNKYSQVIVYKSLTGVYPQTAMFLGKI
ncbi:hypothetical protein [Pedobacter sp. SG908]|uniref:hypothetical protein n=1 Tax=Pedobacter sp. SG908 TaxID=2587135 RepID=UPI0014245AFE|nr:hypothetical protein [Pedobacter sp. SG908]NII81196.1 hypothetical protein [Pedobacter sp. SG908]